MSGSSFGEAPNDRVTAKISDAIVRVLAEHTGHGAARAWTTLDADLVVCVLHDVLSRGEQNLIRHGALEAVLGTRSAYHEMMEDDAVEAVEELSGRSVRAFASADNLDADLAVQIFVLEPTTPSTGTQRRERSQLAPVARSAQRRRGPARRRGD